MFPYALSGSKYLMVQYDPYLGSGYNVMVMEGTTGGSPNMTNFWTNIGSGSFVPSPGDFLRMKVAYDPSSGNLSGLFYDVNNSDECGFSVNIGSDFGVPPDGTYAFGVGADNGLSTGKWALLYVGMTAPPPGYAVTFSESGLPPGDSWSVTLNGTTRSSTSPNITFQEPAGTYSYSVSVPSGLSASPSSGTITVSSYQLSVPVTVSAISMLPLFGAVFAILFLIAVTIVLYRYIKRHRGDEGEEGDESSDKWRSCRDGEKPAHKATFGEP